MISILVYNGIVIIRTGVENNGDYPKILDSVDINNTDNLIKLQYSDDTVVDDDDEQADDADSDDGLLDDAAGVVTDDDAEHGDDFVDSDEEEAPVTTSSAAKAIELKDDLIVKELLQYEPYDYDAPIIPQYSI